MRTVIGWIFIYIKMSHTTPIKWKGILDSNQGVTGSKPVVLSHLTNTLLAGAVGFEPTKTWSQSPVYFQSYVAPIVCMGSSITMRAACFLMMVFDTFQYQRPGTAYHQPREELRFIYVYLGTAFHCSSDHPLGVQM